MQTIVEDAGFIRGRIRAIYGKKLPAVGGLSMGAISALAVVNAHPGEYAGLLAWEGSHVTGDAAVQAHTLPFCNQLNGLVAAGVAVDDQSLPFVKQVAELARTAPNAPFAIPVPGFPPGLTNQQALVFVLSTPNPFAPSPRPGFLSAAGDVGSGQFLFSETERLTGSIARFNDVTANRVVRDLYCSLAGVETAYSSKLAKYKGPVMIIKAGLGFGSVMDELPAKLGSTAVTFAQMHNFGHIDHLGAGNHLFLLELPVAQWLQQVFP
jgi:pimeloyl-ACP methyl ester carboxylesterase